MDEESPDNPQPKLTIFGRCRSFIHWLLPANGTNLGASAFNGMLVVLGIRTPGQKFYFTNSTGFCKVKKLLSPWRIYSLWVLAALCVLPLRFAKELMHTYSDELLLHAISEFILPIQYVFAVVYFGSNHILSFYDVTNPGKTSASNNSLTNIRDIFQDINVENKKTIVEFQYLVRQPCRFTIGVISSITITTLVVTLAGSLATSSITDPISYLFFFISRFHGRGTCLINTIAFAFVFYKHVKVLQLYGEMLEHRDWSSQKYDRISIMLINLTRVRESLKIAREAMRNMYSTGTLTGFLVLGVLIHSTTVSHNFLWSYDSFIIIGSFLTLQLLLLSVVAKLSIAKDVIEDVTKSSQFASKFLSRKPMQQCDALIVTIENASTIDYWLMMHTLSEEWLDFSVLGVPVHSLSFIKQSLSLASILIVLVKTGTFNLTSFLSN